MTKATLLSVLAVISTVGTLAVAQTINDPAHIEVKITPFYNSTGPVINVGPFSKGLAARDEKEFVATITKMKQSWDKLSFAEMYVAAMRLYDLGYRKESEYWFYSAQYRGRLFGTLLDQRKMGTIGNPGFELFHAQNAFFQLAGVNINGYAFGDIDLLVGVIQRVQKEALTIPDFNAVYSGVTFKKKAEWKAGNAEVNSGLTEMLESVKQQRQSIQQARNRNGTEAKFSKLTSKEL